MEGLEALVALTLVEGLGPVTIRRLVRRFGSPAAALEADRGEIAAVDGIGPLLAARIAEARPRAEARRGIERALAAGAAIVPYTDPAYPAPLAEIYDPPVLLYVKGAFAPEDRHAIAVVGARRCSLYGAAQAERLAGQIAAVGMTVASGMARGIDTAAHRGALKARGRTIAVLGSGICRIYPPENRGLAEEIAASGAVAMPVSNIGRSKPSKEVDKRGPTSWPPSRMPRMIDPTVRPSIQPLPLTSCDGGSSSVRMPYLAGE